MNVVASTRGRARIPFSSWRGTTGELFATDSKRHYTHETVEPFREACSSTKTLLPDGLLVTAFDVALLTIGQRYQCLFQSFRCHTRVQGLKHEKDNLRSIFDGTARIRFNYRILLVFTNHADHSGRMPICLEGSTQKHLSRDKPEGSRVRQLRFLSAYNPWL